MHLIPALVTLVLLSAWSVAGAAVSYILPYNCTCLAAGADYLHMNPDVAAANLDPVFHYQNSGGSEGRQWFCTDCDYEPVFPNAPVCNCSDAITQYMNTYGYTGSPATAFQYWINTHLLMPGGGAQWNCQTCVNEAIPTNPATPPPVTDPTTGRGHSANPATLSQQCQCLAARADYLYRYPVVQTAPNNMDPVYYYTNFGAANGDVWNCSLCATNPHYVWEPICNCPEAQKQYMADYAFLYATTSNAWSNYLGNTTTGGFAWKCELCSTNVQYPSSSLTCNCTSARALYLATYTNVVTDPWTHYVSIGQNQGYTWDCGICTDTCPGAYFNGAWLGPSQLTTTSSTALTIPKGCYVGLPDAMNLTTTDFYIGGVLRCKNAATSTYKISANKIWLQGGSIECGTETKPFAGSLTITLTGVKPSVIQPDNVGGDKSIAGQKGSTLSLHGAKLVSWTRLALPAPAGSAKITIAQVTDWRVGDVILIVTTDTQQSGNPTATNEVFSIMGISSDGLTLTLNGSLLYSHACETHNYTFGGNSPLILTKIAEVGLLSGRNIVVKGDDYAVSTGWGGHIMMLAGSRTYISGIEIAHGGQQYLLGRYPFHWHMLGDIPTGQYFKNSSIYFSFNRCITVHGTNNTLVQGNVCYNSIGHQFFLENGVETGNVFDSNLGVLAIRPPALYAILPSDILSGPHAYGPSTFWISNANNTFTNNVAASSIGSGFWYQLEDSATGPYSATDYVPNTKPFGPFHNNIAHSMTEGIVTCSLAGGIYGPNTFSNVWPLTDWQTYGVGIGIWPCGSPQLWQNGIIAEATLGMQDPTKQFLNNVAFVNYIDGAIVKPTTSTGIFLYDSGWAADQIMFKNYDLSPQYSIFRIVAGNDYDTSTRASNVTLINSPYLFTDIADVTDTGIVGEWGAVVGDLDGTLTGHAHGSLTTGHPMVADINCLPVSGAFGMWCPYRYAEPRILFGTTNLPMGQLGRYNYKQAGGDVLSVYQPPASFPAYRLSAIVNTDYVYYLVHPVTSAQLSRITLQPFSMQGDTMALEIRNVISLNVISGATQASSCLDVYNNRAVQSYYMNTVTSTLCLRLVANVGGPSSYGAFGCQASINLQVTRGNVAPTPISNTTANSKNPYAIPAQYQCLAARQDYWNRNPDIYNYPMDPVYHYQHTGGLEGRLWDNSKCAVAPHYISESFCNCSAARQQYLKNYPLTQGDPFTNYLEYYNENGVAWFCNLCPLPTGYGVTSGLGAGPTTGPEGSEGNEKGAAAGLVPLLWMTVLVITFGALI